MGDTYQVEHGPRATFNFAEDAKLVVRHLIKYVLHKKMQSYRAITTTKWDNLFVALIPISFIWAIDHPLMGEYLRFCDNFLHLDRSFAIYLKVSIFSLSAVILYVMYTRYFRQYLLRVLLTYTGWLYQPPRSKSLILIVWAFFVRLFSPRKPELYSFQGSLPRIPVPSLQSTIQNLLESLKPLLDKAEYEKMELDANTFLTTIGPKLQRIIYLKSWWSSHYYSDWWEKYAYLISRQPLPINNNYCMLDQIKWIPTKRQTSRAAGVTSLFLQFKSLIESEKLEPVMIKGTIPLCNWQYQRMFGTTRIPGIDCDILKHHPSSEHIVVFVKGYFYKVTIKDTNGKRLNHLDFESLFEWIMKDAMKRPVKSQAELNIASLTANERTTWARCRSEHFMSGINRHSLQAIEEAIFLVVLDDHEFTDPDERLKYLLHGKGSTYWFDKAICLILFTDGRCGANIEHSWSDGTIMHHVGEYVLTNEYCYRLYDDDGYCKPYFTPDATSSMAPSKAVVPPTLLNWEIDNALEKIIDQSYHFAMTNNADLDACTKLHEMFGKGVMKKAKISPDAFIQMALQLAYYKDSGGSFANTYEPAMMRLYLQGRTETVRPFTQEVKEFVLAMNDSNLAATEKIRLMRVASEKHQKISRDCMSGKGIDRHLFALYVVCKARGYVSPFLENVLSMPWTLSTSQSPVSQMNHGLDLNIRGTRDAYSPGGCFGTVSPKGYGVAYVLLNDSTISFHVTSRKSCPTTDTKRYMDNIYWALSEMKKVADETGSV